MALFWEKSIEKILRQTKLKAFYYTSSEIVEESLKQSDKFEAFGDLLALIWHINCEQVNGCWVIPSLHPVLRFY